MKLYIVTSLLAVFGLLAHVSAEAKGKSHGGSHHKVAKVVKVGKVK
jgi:hypothetical protein